MVSKVSSSQSPEVAQWSVEAKAAQMIPLSVDLVSAAKVELALVQAVDRLPCLYGGPAVARAIQRYEQCWLPSVAEWESSAGQPMAPLDVQWIWHCHMLNPVTYAEDCQRLCGKIIGYAHGGHDSQGSAQPLLLPLDLSRQLWSARFPNEPYDLDLSQFRAHSSSPTPSTAQPQDASDASPRENKYESPIKLDLAAAAARQTAFSYQVDRPWMNSTDYLTHAVERYQRFLHLISKNTISFLVPTYDIDVIWHAHMRCAVAYGNDTRAIFGKILNHDDNVTDRSTGSKLANGFEGTRAAWHAAFGTAYGRAGAMYRGEKQPPSPPILPLPPSPATSVSSPAPLAQPPPSSRSSSPSTTPGRLPRHDIVETSACVLQVVGLEEDGSYDVFVVMEAMRGDGNGFNVRTRNYPHSGTPFGDVQEKLLFFERPTQGLKLTLNRQRVGGNVAEKMGEVSVRWVDVMSRPGLALNDVLPLKRTGSKVTGLKWLLRRYKLRVSISVTPFHSPPPTLRFKSS